MGVVPSHDFPNEAMTPTCSSCGVALCWDISIPEYEEDIEFWDNWECETCNPDYKKGKRK